MGGCVNSSTSKAAGAVPLAPEPKLIVDKTTGPDVAEPTIIMDKTSEPDIEKIQVEQICQEPAAEPAPQAEEGEAMGTEIGAPSGPRIEEPDSPPTGALDCSDEVKIEEEELVLSNRGTSGCGCCAEQTDSTVSFCWGLFSCTCQSNAGLSYYRGCC